MPQKFAFDRRTALLAGGDCLNSKSKRPGIGSRARPVFRALTTAPARIPGRPICDIKTCPPPPGRVPHSTPYRPPLQTFQARTVITEVVMASQEPTNLLNHRRSTPNTRPTTNGATNQHTPLRDPSNPPTTKSPRKSRSQISNPNTPPPRPTGTPPPQTPPHSPQPPHRRPAPTRTTSPSTTAATLRTAAVATTPPSHDPRLPRHTPAAARHARIPLHHRRRSATRPPCRRKTIASHPCLGNGQQRQR